MTTWVPLENTDLAIDDAVPAATGATPAMVARVASRLGVVLAPEVDQPLPERSLGRRRRGVGPALLAEATATSAVLAGASAVVAGRALAVAALVGAAWVALVGARVLARPCAGTPRPLAERARSAAALALGCWLVSAVVALPVSSLELQALIAGLAVASSLAAWTVARLVGATRTPLVIVVGGGEALPHEVEELRRGADPALVCLPRPEDRERLPEGFALPVVVGLEELVPSAAAYDADAVVVLPGALLDAADLRRLSWSLEAEGIALLVSTGLRDVADHRARLSRLAGINTVQVDAARRGGPGGVVKDVLERVAAATGLLLLAPLLLGIAIAIRADSSGGAVFRQRRIGRDGRPFTLYKFRTMALDAETRLVPLADENEHSDGPLFKIRRDPRVTRIGRFLRRYSLDELPQLVNVVVGQMSLVGPRPALPDEVAAYLEDPRRRLVVKPGLTGLWQVSGRSDLSWEETVRLDLQYVDNWSLRLDLVILLRTVNAVLSHRGAY